MKLTRSLIAGSTALAVAFTAVPAIAPAAQAQSSVLDTGVTAINVVLGLIGSIASLAIFLGFWGTVYNFLVNHNHVQGRTIPGLPVF